MRKLILGLLLGGLFVPFAFAEPRLKIDPPAKKITVDQTAVLTIRLEWPQSEGPYEINPRQPKLENLELVKHNQSQSISISSNPKLGQSWLPSTRETSEPGQSQETGATVSHALFYEFRPVKKGAAVIYPFEVSYKRPDAEAWTPLMVPEQNISVVPQSPLRSIFIGFFVLAGVSVIIFASFKIGSSWMARTAAKNMPPPDPKQRLYGKAEETIATFVSSDPKEKITLWSNLLKSVVGTYYGLPYEKESLAGVLSHLRSKGLPAGEWNEVSRIVERLSELQFSRQDIPAHDLEETQKTLLQYVRGKIIIGNSNS